MDRPVQMLLALTAAVLTSAGAAAAEDVDSSRKQPRAISPRVAEMLAAAAPKYEPAPAPAESAARENRLSPSDVKPANTIVRLPEYLVRSRRLPAPEEVMTRGEKEKFAMQKYLGDENGLERVLNMFSVAGLWSKIPVLGKYPFLVGQSSGRNAGLPVGPRTNEQRALDLYEKELMAQRWAALDGLLSPQLRPAAPPPVIETGEKK